MLTLTRTFNFNYFGNNRAALGSLYSDLVGHNFAIGCKFNIHTCANNHAAFCTLHGDRAISGLQVSAGSKTVDLDIAFPVYRFSSNQIFFEQNLATSGQNRAEHIGVQRDILALYPALFLNLSMFFKFATCQHEITGSLGTNAFQADNFIGDRNLIGAGIDT